MKASRFQRGTDHRCSEEATESFPHRLEQAEIRRFHAMMLMDRAEVIAKKRKRYLVERWRVTSVSECPAIAR
jgi:hypothetical protein